MTISKISTLIKAIEVHLPHAHSVLQSLITAIGNQSEEQLTAIFATLANESVDAALLEKTENLVVITANFPWDDVGTWTSLDRIHPKNDSGNIVTGECIIIDSENCTIQNQLPGMEVAVIGMEDVVVVVSKHGVLVCPKHHAQRVKEVPQAIRTRKENL